MKTQGEVPFAAIQRLYRVTLRTTHKLEDARQKMGRDERQIVDQLIDENYVALNAIDKWMGR